MFDSGTILRLRDPQSTDDTPYPYDLVEVVGQSPLQYSTGGDSPWAGQDAIGFIIKPAGETFGPTIDKPLGQLQELYEVESFPTDPTTGEPLRPENNPQNLPSPESVFRQLARDDEVVKRDRAASFQHDGKSPEQVLREAAQVEKQKAAAKAKARKEAKTDGGS